MACSKLVVTESTMVLNRRQVSLVVGLIGLPAWFTPEKESRELKESECVAEWDSFTRSGASIRQT